MSCCGWWLGFVACRACGGWGRKAPRAAADGDVCGGDGDEACFGSVEVRLARPVFPGETVRTEMWCEEGGREVFIDELLEKILIRMWSYKGRGGGKLSHKSKDESVLEFLVGFDDFF